MDAAGNSPWKIILPPSSCVCSRRADALEGRRSRNETLIHSGRIGLDWAGNFLAICKVPFLLGAWKGWDGFAYYNLKIRIVIFESNLVFVTDLYFKFEILFNLKLL